VQIHVWPKEAIDQLFLLILTVQAGQSGHYHYGRQRRFSHKRKVPEFGRSCKEILIIRFPGYAERPGNAWPLLALLFIVFHRQLRNTDRMPEHVYKKIEIVGSSSNGFEEAVQNALTRAKKTVRNMRWFEVTETRGNIDEDGIGDWQVTLKIGFTLDE
jgi:flavin-binding protein dodecin